MSPRGGTGKTTVMEKATSATRDVLQVLETAVGLPRFARQRAGRCEIVAAMVCAPVLAALLVVSDSLVAALAT